MLNEAQDRIAFAAEGLALAAADAVDVARDRALVLLTALAALAAVAFLLMSGGGATTMEDAGARASAAPPPEGISPPEGTYIGERGFSLSLPSGWERSDSPLGAAFAATSADGLAKTTLWVERDPSLGFEAFVEQSTQTLGEIGSNVRVIDRVGGPAIESQIAELRAEVPLDGDVATPYRVTLRAAGPYRYYLATSIQPGAPAQLAADAELLGGSFRPQVEPQGKSSPK